MSGVQRTELLTFSGSSSPVMFGIPNRPHLKKHEIEFPGKSHRTPILLSKRAWHLLRPLLKDGSQVEVGMFGYESIIGVSALMGTKRSLNRVYTQIPGYGYSCKVNVARKEFRLCGPFQEMALRYVQAQLVQAI